MRNVPGTPTRWNNPSDPAVVAVGWVDGERLVWPWDAPSIASESHEPDPEFTRAMDQARRAEFAEQRYDHAVDLYRQAIATAHSDTQRASARLGLGGAQLRAGQRTAAVSTYRDILKLPSAMTDDHGLSYWSAAATPLAYSNESTMTWHHLHSLARRSDVSLQKPS